MAKQDVIEVEAIIVEALPNAMFKAKLIENDVVILAHVSGKIRMNYIRILPGNLLIGFSVNPLLDSRNCQKPKCSRTCCHTRHKCHKQ